jgi:hypothetical protein
MTSKADERAVRMTAEQAQHITEINCPDFWRNNSLSELEQQMLSQIGGRESR